MAEKKLNVESKKFMALSGIKENDKKFLTNESFLATGDYKNIDESNDETDEDFTIIEFEQTEVQPGGDDEKLYKLS